VRLAKPPHPLKSRWGGGGYKILGSNDAKNKTPGSGTQIVSQEIISADQCGFSGSRIAKMSTVTVIKYDVLEAILRDWLWREFGTAAKYEVCKIGTFIHRALIPIQPASESGAGYWKVTATRLITQVR